MFDGGSSGYSTEAVTLFPHADAEEKPWHSATPGEIEQTADEIQSSAKSISALDPEVATAHRPAVTGTDGDLSPLLAEAPEPTIDNIHLVAAATYVAAGATRQFAGGVRRFNDEVDGLRAEYDERRDEIMSSRFGIDADTHPDPEVRSDALKDRRGEELATLVGELRSRQRTIRETLTTEGERAAGLLHQADPGKDGSADRALQKLFAGGFLPSTTPMSFPDVRLALKRMPYDIAGLTDHELAERLDDPQLDPVLREAIVERYPDAVELFAKDWKLTPDGHRSDCDGGAIIGPDGRLYPVQQPVQPPPGSGPTAQGEYDFIPDQAMGWTTLGADIGDITFGDPITLGERILWTAAGTTMSDGMEQSIGTAQEDYVAIGTDGSSLVVNGVEYDPADYERPPSGPVAESYEPPSPNVITRSQDAVDLIADRMEGWITADRMDANRHYSTHVVFQENEDGSRRAVLRINQVQAYDDNIGIASTPATISGSGEIVPIESDAYGQPTFENEEPN